ncbi:MAG: DnaJ domain-containing protein [Deltaproteobacteria bacterium]|nr:MAG: DnaJ domain-containing protein [Deltaproteobacteria bacterium]
MASLPARGQLDEVPVPRLLFDLYKAHFTGTLELSRERVNKRIQFLDGVPTFVESNLASESLGIQLMDDGTISREDYSRVVGYVALKKCKEGKALLDLKLLQPKDLFSALKEQVRRRVVECFGWPQGEFVLNDSATPADAQAFRTDPLALLQSGLEAHWTSDRILTSLGDQLRRYPKPSRRFEGLRDRLETDAAVDRLFEALDGKRTLGELIVTAQSPRALAAAWILDAAGGLEYADARVDDAPETIDDDTPPPPPEIEIVVGSAPAGGGAAWASAAGRPEAGARVRAANPDAESMRADILAQHAKLRDLDYYALLGVERKASPAEIRRAYFRLAKRYHPDALASAGLDDVRQQANDIFARVSKAHEVLVDVMQRRDYDRSLADGDGDEDDQASRVANAEIMYRKAEILLRRGDFKGALQFLKPAVELWPEDTEYQSALGWALFKQPKAEPEPAREHLEKSIALDAQNAVALHRLALVLRASGDEAGAAKYLKQAKAIDPKADARG